ncbi:MAG: PAC2 family protein, partial [Frankia sp.]|nr:PAC2 family protein [Frankia sp.]
MIAAFEGWNDAGDAASGVVDHLEAVWHAQPLAAIDPEDYYDFQVNRPTVSLVDGTTRRIEWPTTRFSVVRLAAADRDVVLTRGLEPNMRWRAFCAEILTIAEELGVELVVMLGALLADAPHTRPTPLSGTASDPQLAAKLGLDRSRYEGPTGIVGVLGDLCSQSGLPAVSFWAAVPHYVAQPPNPKATLALLRRLEDVLDVHIPLGDLPEQSRAWQQRVDELAA